jgi:CDP-paratose 2-epimerase
MRVFITGICGFVGSSIAQWLRARDSSIQVLGVDNFLRTGSESNRTKLRSLGMDVRHGDIRNASDFETLPSVDWVIDAAAAPSVLAGVDGITSSRQLLEHNLKGTVNILEYCKRTSAGLVLLSTSRVYGIRDLASLPLTTRAGAFQLDDTQPLPVGISVRGIGRDFSTSAPVSLYGSTKLASEILALEYGDTFAMPVWINRCGVLAGAGQFGTAEQGIFSFWIHAYARKRPLKYIGFHGAGYQVRDAFHPDDLAALIFTQMTRSHSQVERIFNIGGGAENAMSLAQLTRWCAAQFGTHAVASDLTPRPFDIPWLVMDYSRATDVFGWRPQRTLKTILEDLKVHAEQNRQWLELTGGM